MGVGTTALDLLIISAEQPLKVFAEISVLLNTPIIDDIYNFPNKFISSASIDRDNETQGPTSACFQSTSDSKYHLYQVLIVR